MLLDANNSQVDGPIDTITTIEPIAEKWAAFGWHAQDIDGHDTASLAEAIAAADAETARPSVVVCRTSTVHGLKRLPSDADGHFIKLPPEPGRGRARGADRRTGGPACVSRPT